MDKFQEVIVRHENARKLVKDLKQKRLRLIYKCENTDFIEDQGFQIPVGELCLKTAFDNLLSTVDENYGESYSYDEILNEMHCEGTCCDSCLESYQVKTGPLADARQEFGNAKRQLSYIAKKLIK